MSRPPDTARNAASSYALRGVLAVTTLGLTPYLFRRLGLAGFGTYSVAFTVSTIFGLLEYGFSSGVTKLSAELRAQGRTADLAGLVRSAVYLMMLAGLASLAVCVGLGFLDGALAAQGAFLTGMVLLGVACLVRFPLAPYGALLLGYQRYDLFNAAKAAATVVWGIGTVVAVEAGAGLVGAIGAYAASLLVDPLIQAVLLRRLDRTIPFGIARGARATRRELFRFSSYVLLAGSMTFIGQRMDTLVIAALRNAATAAPYAAAIKLQTGLQSLTQPFVNLLMPMASDLSARGREDEVMRRLTLATRATLQLTLPVAVGAALFADDIVRLWLGSTAPPVTADIIVLLMLVQTVTLTAAAAEETLVGIGRVKTIGRLAALEGTSNLALSIALVSKHGAIGAAIGTAVTSGLLAPLKFPLACRSLGERTTAFLAQAIVPALMSSVPAVAVMAGVYFAIPPGAPRLFAGMVLGFGLALLVGLHQVGPPRALSALRSAFGRPDKSVAETA